MAVLKRAGADEIIAVDVQERPLEAALALGAAQMLSRRSWWAATRPSAARCCSASNVKIHVF
jgi:Zn-dependent alcohol dehydrogenase